MKKALFLCLPVLLLMTLLSPSAGAGAGVALTVGGPEPEGEGIYRLVIGLSGAPKGDICGILLSVSLSDGWTVVGAEQGSAAYLTLTLRTTADGARLLLDGVPAAGEVPSGGPLLFLLLAQTGGAAACTVTLGAESPLYYMESPGRMRACPVSGCRGEWRVREREDEAGTACAVTTEADAGNVCAVTSEPPAETARATEREPDGEGSTGPAEGQGSGETLPDCVPAGCREAVTAEELVVEMLFLPEDGAGKSCPAAWLEVCPGGVRVTLERAAADGYTGWRFRGLPLRGRVVLAAAGADGRLYRAVYTDGRFDGWM